MKHKNGAYLIDDVPIQDIAKKYGTPCFVYSESSIISNFQEISNIFCNEKRSVYYSVKANSSLTILKLLSNLGAGFDIVSIGELNRVIKVGADPKKIVYSGVGKSESDIESSIQLGIKCLNVESFAELERINKVASKLKIKAF